MRLKHTLALFGLTSLYPSQEEVVNSILFGNDTVAVFPTGFGKSLCYQIPGICFPHLTLVISPLLALMQDQVAKLTSRGIAAASWNSALSRSEERELLRNLLEQKLKILYLSPEKLLHPPTKALLLQMPMSQVAVDEAHCISEWGPEFRPQYAKIGKFIRQYVRQFPRPVVSAFTATARRETIRDIRLSLDLNAPHLYSHPFSRPHLRYQVIPVTSEASKRRCLRAMLCWWMSSLNGSALVYAATRLETEFLSQWLSWQGFPARAFHAGLFPSKRQRLLQEYQETQKALLVATSAFGLGVDKKDIRLVIHHSCPVSLEAYAQEAGRAGRDGEMAWPLLFFHPEDFTRNLEIARNGIHQPSRLRHLRQQAQAMMKFATSTGCWGKQLTRYFALPGTIPQRLPCSCGVCQPTQSWLQKEHFLL